MISTRAIALSGYGFGARSIAVSGYVAEIVVPPDPPTPPSGFLIPAGPPLQPRKRRDPRRQNEAILLALLR